MINWCNVDENLLQQAKVSLNKKNKNILEIKKNTEKRINIDRLEFLVQELVNKWAKLVVIDHLNEFELTWDKDRNDLTTKLININLDWQFYTKITD